MEKTATLNLRISPEVKRDAEGVLSRLGIPMSTAITMYLKQIALTGGIPFVPKLPAAPRSLDLDQMTDEELCRLLADRLADASEQGISLSEARDELLG